MNNAEKEAIFLLIIALILFYISFKTLGLILFGGILLTITSINRIRDIKDSEDNK